jgi:hypothetical protein
MPPISLRPPERTLTPEECERQKQIDDDYKAASKKVPDQKANDPLAAIRPAPSTPSPKTPTVAGPKKKQQ